MISTVQKNLVEKNAEYAAGFEEGHLALPPVKSYVVGKYSTTCKIRRGQPELGSSTRKTYTDRATSSCVVTCMDARIDPKTAFGIALGDAHVIRNAGGSAKEAKRSLVISQQLLGTNEILVIKHTGCGMLTFRNEDAHKVVQKNLGDGAREELADLDFLPFADLEQAVKDDVALLRGSKAIPDNTTISGWVYDVETGKIRAIE
jgi:carbonic anhydrase